MKRRDVVVAARVGVRSMTYVHEFAAAVKLNSVGRQAHAEEFHRWATGTTRPDSGIRYGMMIAIGIAYPEPASQMVLL
jgi:hypothetical protein